MSLVPHATEPLFALGLGDRVVGVRHECAHPAAARRLPRVTRPLLPPGLDQAGVDAAVGASRVVAFDASGLFSRPGPRLVDGLTTLAHALHPDRVPEAPGAVLDLPHAGRTAGALA